MCGTSSKIVLLAAAIVWARGASGQDLHLKSRSIYTGPQTRIPRRAVPVHQIIQFDHPPGVEDLESLFAAGYKVVAAVPDNAVMVIAPARTTVTAQTDGVRWIGELEAQDKLSPELSKAGPDGSQAIVEFHADVDGDAQQSILEAEGLTFKRPAALLANQVIVTASIGGFQTLASRDEVAYIFPADPALPFAAPDAANDLMPCGGMLTLAGPVAQYANVMHGWNLDSDHAAHLGYAFGTLASTLPAGIVQSEILRAMNAWSAVANVVFEFASNAASPRTILIRFAAGEHGDSYPFDGRGRTLAHTFYPVPLNAESIAGDVHLDADENWHAGGDTDIYSVVLHEIGHAIGLGHSDKPGDVMYPYYRRGMQLSENDIGAAQQLYGAPAVLTRIEPAPISASPVHSASPLSIALDPAPPPGEAAQTTVTGNVSGGVPPLALQYQTDHGYSGKVILGDAGRWSASGIGLVTGANTVTVTAFDSAHESASQSENISRAAPVSSAGATPLGIAISSPSSAVATVKTAAITVAGTASGGTGITRVTWQSSTGATGTADGTGHWLASNIPLLTGTNTIVVRAFDARGASAWASAMVVRR